MIPRLEVVIFAFQHEEFIERTLASVVAQRTAFAFNIRIHDDASTDRTVEVARRFLGAGSIPWLIDRAPKNRYAHGIEYFHQFIAASHAEYVAVLDGDDFWLDDGKLQAQVDLLDRFPACALCHHPVMTFTNKGLQALDWPPPPFRQKILAGWRLSEQNFVSSSSVVLRMSAFPRIMPAGFNELSIGDYPMWALATAGHDIAFIDTAMSAYRVHGANIWAQLSSSARLRQEFAARLYIASNVAIDQSRWRSATETRLQQVVDDLTGRARHAEDETLRVEAEITLIRATWSWRVTQPLRFTRRLTRRSIAPHGPE